MLSFVLLTNSSTFRNFYSGTKYSVLENGTPKHWYLVNEFIKGISLLMSYEVCNLNE